MLQHFSDKVPYTCNFSSWSKVLSKLHWILNGCWTGSFIKVFFWIEGSRDRLLCLQNEHNFIIKYLFFNICICIQGRGIWKVNHETHCDEIKRSKWSRKFTAIYFFVIFGTSDEWEENIGQLCVWCSNELHWCFSWHGSEKIIAFPFWSEVLMVWWSIKLGHTLVAPLSACYVVDNRSLALSASTFPTVHPVRV